MNTIYILRYTKDDQPTLGHVVVVPDGGERFQCFSLEDRYRQDKVAGDTRIPGGTYDLEWRTIGRFAKRWQGRGYPGSLQLMDVPGFEAILIHAGNTKSDTTGCLLLGMGGHLAQRTISHSRDAVARVYSIVAGHTGPWQIAIEQAGT